WALLGGRTRNKIRVYQSTGGATPQQAGENAKQLVEKYGYTALKMGIQAPGDMPYNQATRSTAEHVRAVREAVGPDVDIAVDVHAKFFEAERAIRLAKAIEPYDPMWMEESVRPENYDAMKKVADHVSIPLATAINVHFAASTPNF